MANGTQSAPLSRPLWVCCMAVFVSMANLLRPELLLVAHHNFLDPPVDTAPTTLYGRDTYHWICADVSLFHPCPTCFPARFTITRATPVSTRRPTFRIGRRTGRNSNMAFTVDCHTVHVNQLTCHFQRTLRCKRRSCGSEKCPSTGRTKFCFARPRMACSSRMNQKLDVVSTVPDSARPQQASLIQWD